MSADSPRRSSRGIAVPATVPPQVVSDHSILDSAIGFINDVTLANQPHTDPKDTITWARFESAADISDPRYGEDWELEGNVAPPLLLILGYGLGVQVWAIPANGEAVEVLSWRHGVVSALRVLPTPAYSAAIDENGRADEPVDAYAEKRPLIAMVDSSTSTGAPPQFSAVNFVSLKTGTQVKTIKFKNTVLDILANRSSIVITFNERIAVFDARTLEDRLSITTCYPSPGINQNPVALGPRWLAYAEHRLIPAKRSGGGCDGDGVASYTATVLNAAKSFGKGLRELGEQVAAGLTGTTGSGSTSKNNSFDSCSGGDARQPGIVTIMDIKNPVKDYSPTSSTPTGHVGSDPIVAHFIAHSEALVAMEFDNSGMLLLTADRRGHDFHIFRVQPHPVGSSLAAVHHLYVLHRGDTSAKVQHVAFSLDSRWAAVSTLRGTTHVFPITPYGGPMGVRTHTSLHVVNKLSRFHRSAGLSADGRSSSPISHSESTTFVQSLQPYHNPTLPPFPRPTVVLPLAQLRQPFALGSPPGSAALSVGGKAVGSGGSGGGSSASQRQRLSSLSDDNGKPLSVCAIFAKSRSWLLDPPNATREAPHRIQRKAVDSLFVMAGHGALIQYDLDTKLASNVAKEKICDDTPIELEVEAKAQWNLGRRRDGSHEIMPPLTSDNWLVKNRNSCMLTDSTRQFDELDDRTESWLAQVEIITHAGPHRRLWMGPQCVFKTYNTPSGSNLNHVDAEAVEIGISKPAAAAAAATTARSSPLNMPLAAAGRSAVPVLIESGSYSSIEQSPKLMDRFRHEHLDSDFAVAHGDSRLKEDLADAMRESPSVSAAHKDTGRLPSDAASSDNPPFYDALAEHDHDDDDYEYDPSVGIDSHAKSAATLANLLPNIHSFDTGAGYESLDSMRKPQASIAKVVNPLGTVTTVTAGMSAEVQTDILDEVVSQLAAEECVIHENCDESLFRPVVAIFCDEKARKAAEQEDAARKDQGLCDPPEAIRNKLIVPVIAKEVDAELTKKENQKSGAKAKLKQRSQEQSDREEQQKFAELSSLNRKTKGRGGSDFVDGRSTQQLQSVDVKNEQIKIKQEKFEASKDNKVGEQLKSATNNIKAEIRQDNVEAKQERKSVDAKRTKEPAVVIKQEPLRKAAEEAIVEVSKVTTKTEKVVEAGNIKQPIQIVSKPEKIAEAVKATTKKERIAEAMKATAKPEKAADVMKAAPKPETDVEVMKATTKSEKITEPIKATPKTERKVESKTEKAAEVMKASPKTEKAAEIIKASSKTEKPVEITPKLEMAAKNMKTASMPSPTVEEGKTKSNLTSGNDSAKSAAQQEEKILSKKSIDISSKKEISASKELKKISVAETSVSREVEPKPAAARENAEMAKVKAEVANEKVEIHQEKPNIAKETAVAVKEMPKVGKASPKKSAKKETPPESEEEIVMEFKRMTPLTVEKSKKSCAESVSAKAKTAAYESKTKPKEFTAIEIEKPKSFATKFDKEKCALEKAKPVQETTNLPALDPLKPLEPVEIFASPKSSPKKNKQKTLNRSNSSSETEEIIALPRNSGQSGEKNAMQAKYGKKSSASSDDLADSLLEIKSQLEETMYISCTEKPKELDAKLKTRGSETLIASEKLAMDVDKNVQTPSVTQDVDSSEKDNDALFKPVFKFGGLGNVPVVDTNAAEAAELKAADARSLFVFEATTDMPTAERKLKKKNSLTQATNVQHKTYTFNVIDFPAPAPIATAKEQTPAVKTPAKKDSRLFSEMIQKQAEKPLEEAENPESKKLKTAKTETVAPKSPKKPLTETSKHNVAIAPSHPPMVMAHKTDDSGTGKKSTTKMEEAKVITEQPAAAKSSVVEKPAPTTVDKRETKVVAKASEPVKSPKSSTVAKDVTDSVKSATLSPKKSPKSPKPAAEISTPAPAPVACAWKTLSGAEMISKNLERLQSNSANDSNYPSLGTVIKSKKSPKGEMESRVTETSEKLLPDLPTPLKPLEDFISGSAAANRKQTKKCEQLVLDFEPLRPLTLEPMPPLPALEPLDIVSPGPSKKGRETKAGRNTPSEQLVLINFESPPQEESSTPLSGTVYENLALALCGSLHYEDEGATKGADGSALTHSSSVLGENDEQYMSLEQSSQETNTTNTATTNDKFSSSPNSSASEEIIVLEEKKLSKKQRRRRLQNDQTAAAVDNDNEANADEELRPLIAWSKSQWEQSAEPGGTLPPRPGLTTAPAPSSPLARSTTTDSEGPMPATTSDDNVFTLPAALSPTVANAPNKLKTKKLEHKINLIAAIEAATSSSTSSAEESGVEAGGGRASDMDMSLIAVAQPTPAQASAAKKKTKRRFNFALAPNPIKNVTTTTTGSNSSINSSVDITDCNNKNNAKNQKSTDASAMKTSGAINAPMAETEDLTLSSSIAMHNSHCNTSGSCTSIGANSSLQLSASGTSYGRYMAGGGEQNTIINIDSYDDQLSLSSLPSSSSPPLSLNGVFDTNLMHFPAGGDIVEDDVGAYGDADGGSVDGDSGGGGSL